MSTVKAFVYTLESRSVANKIRVVRPGDEIVGQGLRHIMPYFGLFGPRRRRMSTKRGRPRLSCTSTHSPPSSSGICQKTSRLMFKVSRPSQLGHLAHKYSCPQSCYTGLPMLLIVTVTPTVQHGRATEYIARYVTLPCLTNHALPKPQIQTH